MRIGFVGCMVFLVGVWGRGDAAAQGAYVGASVFGDIVRTSHLEPSGADGNAGGETVGVALRLGTPIGESWGVEAEFAYPGTIAAVHETVSLPLVDSGIAVPGLPGVTRAPTALFPSFVYRTDAESRYTTLSAGLWYEQTLSARLSLAYLGGIAFARTIHEVELTYAPLILTPLPIVPIRSKAAEYGVRPLVGFEARLAMSDALRLVPAIRMQASANTWVVRPSVGVNWMF